MPLRINLLAEQQALEEMRLRDPVKRAVWVGAFLVALMLIWSSTMLAKSMLEKSEVSRLESENRSHEEAHRKILDNQRKLADINLKLAALYQMATNRFLMGNLLNVMQQVTVSDVQLTSMKVNQSYAFTEAVKEVKSTTGDKPIAAKPATCTERITLILDAKDASPDAGAGISKYQEQLSGLPYFQNPAGRPLELKLTRRGTPMVDLDGKLTVVFALECRFPDKIR